MLYDHATEIGLEGIISKRADATYLEARSKTWVKTKALQKADFPIVGYTLSTAAAGIGAIALGEWVDGELEYRGKCGTGFVASDLTAILSKLEPLTAPDQKLDGMPKDVISVRPVITAHVHYANLTADNSVRHAVFKGLREPEIKPSEAPVKRKRLISDADLAGIWVTNPTRRLFGKSGPTKLDIAVYYARWATSCCRIFSAGRCRWCAARADGSTTCFFQRHAVHRHAARRRQLRDAEQRGRREQEVHLDRGRQGLSGAGAVRRGRVPRLGHATGPTRSKSRTGSIFDLDPGEGIKFRRESSMPQFIREAVLEGLGLVPFVKTSGGKGLHVVVPLKPKLDWKKTHAATGEIASAIAKAAPETFMVNMGKDKRSKRIFIDFHRNYRGATAVAPYQPARSRQPAGLDAAQLGRSAFSRGAGGPELFFPARAGDGAWRSLGGNG